jgi:hypothetical protein
MLIEDMLLFDTTNYNVSTMPKNLKVINIIFTSTINAWIYLYCQNLSFEIVLHKMYWGKCGLRKLWTFHL